MRRTRRVMCAAALLALACQEDRPAVTAPPSPQLARGQPCRVPGRTPVIDGRLCADEWSGAKRFKFAANVPEGGTTRATLLVQNDGVNLYLAVRVARNPAVDGGGQAVFEFDNDGDGELENGNDVILHGSDGNFFDDFRTNAPPCQAGSGEGSCAFFDTSDGGTNDGAGAHENDGTFAVYELVHPLNSTDDAHDFSLAAGQTLGLSLSLNLLSPGGANVVTFFPGPSAFNYTFVTIEP